MGIPELNLVPPEHVNPAGKLQLLEHREELIGVLESGLLDRRQEESLAHQKWCPTSTARNCDDHTVITPPYAQPPEGRWRGHTDRFSTNEVVGDNKTPANADSRTGRLVVRGAEQADSGAVRVRAPGAENPREHRADAGTRTPDPFITSEVLYQLSYVGESAGHRSVGYATGSPKTDTSFLHRGAHPRSHAPAQPPSCSYER